MNDFLYIIVTIADLTLCPILITKKLNVCTTIVCKNPDKKNNLSKNNNNKSNNKDIEFVKI